MMVVTKSNVLCFRMTTLAELDFNSLWIITCLLRTLHYLMIAHTPLLGEVGTGWTTFLAVA